MKKVLCPYCNDGVLQSFEGDGEEYSGYVCEYGSTSLEALAKEEGCSRLIDSVEYKRLAAKQAPSSSEPAKTDKLTDTTTNTPAAPLARLAPKAPLNRLPLRPPMSSTAPQSRPPMPTTMATRSAPGGRPVINRGLIMPAGKGRGRSKAKGKGSDSEDDWEGESTSEDEKQPLSFDTDDEDDENNPNSTTPGANPTSNQQYNTNAALMRVGDNITVARASIIPSLTVQGMENPLAYGMKKRFVPPKQDEAIARKLPWDARKLGNTLGVNRYAVAKKMNKFVVPVANYAPPEINPGKLDADGNPTVFQPPPGFQPLVVWAPTEEDQARHKAAHEAASTNADSTPAEIPPLTPIEVPPVLAHWLRPHQREGVQFLCECTLEQRDFQGQGAILADDMGLGKTLQSVALIYTLLTQGFQQGTTVAKKVIVCCPTSLVRNWANEFVKWIGEGVVNVVALAESSKDAVLRGIRKYVLEPQVQVLVISYETFRRYANRIYPRDCDLLVCDEAHRLKNAETETYTALDKLKCRRRILLSGTPMQNDLGEFFAMVNFTNKGVLGDASTFSRKFEGPILRGREPGSSDKEKKLGEEKALELSQLVNMFILRRTNTLLSKHLPPKVMEIVCCNMTPLQKAIYQHFQNQKAVADLITAPDIEDGEEVVLDDEIDQLDVKAKGKGGKQILPLIGLLKGLCSHPKLVYEALQTALKAGKSHCPGLDEDLLKLFPPDFEKDGMHPRYSGKLTALDRLMCTVRAHSTDKFVLISNYTQTLDIFEALCKFRGWEYLRVDGGTSIKARQERVDKLCAAGSTAFVFLLSSKAGGCGLNLVGANRLVLFDPDWNPAVDKQAAARVWRDGQTKRCFVYRFLASGSIEEKVYQRQLSKEGLADVVGGNNSEASVSMKELKDLFRLRLCISDTHDTLACQCAKHGEDWDWEEPVEDDAEEEGGIVHSDEEEEKREKVETKSMVERKENGDGDDAVDDAEKLEKELLRQKKAREQKKMVAVGKNNQCRQECVWRQRGNPAEDDLGNWSHHYSVMSVPDVLMRMTHTSIWRGTGYPNAPLPTHEPVPPPVPIPALVAASTKPIERIGIVRAIAKPMATAHLTQPPKPLQWRELSICSGPSFTAPVRASKRIGAKMAAAEAAAGFMDFPDVQDSEVVQPMEIVEVDKNGSPIKPDPASGTSPGKTSSPSKFRIPVSRTASPMKDRLGVYDPLCDEPVLFVFACEVDGKPLDGIEEDLNKTVTTAVDDGRQRPRKGKGKVVPKDTNEDPNANLVEVITRSRLPMHLRLKSDEEEKESEGGKSNGAGGSANGEAGKKRKREGKAGDGLAKSSRGKNKSAKVKYDGDDDDNLDSDSSTEESNDDSASAPAGNLDNVPAVPTDAAPAVADADDSTDFHDATTEDDDTEIRPPPRIPAKPKSKSAPASRAATPHTLSANTSNASNASHASGVSIPQAANAPAPPPAKTRGRPKKTTSDPMLTASASAPATPAPLPARRKRKNAYEEYDMSEAEMLAWALRESKALAEEQERKTQELRASQEMAQNQSLEQEKGNVAVADGVSGAGNV